MSTTTETARIDVTVLGAVSLFASKEETRYYLNGVYLEIEPRSVTYVATDGHRLMAYRDALFDAENANTCVGNFIVPTAQCRVFKCRKDGIPAATLTQDEKTLTLEHDGIGLTFAPIDGQFPDWRRTVPRGPFSDNPAQFNLAYMSDFAKFAKLLSLPAPFVRHDTLHTPACIEFGGYPHIVALQMPMRVEGHAVHAVPDWAHSVSGEAQAA